MTIAINTVAIAMYSVAIEIFIHAEQYIQHLQRKKWHVSISFTVRS